MYLAETIARQFEHDLDSKKFYLPWLITYTMWSTLSSVFVLCAVSKIAKISKQIPSHLTRNQGLIAVTVFIFLVSTYLDLILFTCILVFEKHTVISQDGDQIVEYVLILVYKTFSIIEMMLIAYMITKFLRDQPE